MATVTNRIGTINISDGTNNTYVKKQLVSVSAVGDNVVIGWYYAQSISFPYTYFSSPSGVSASAVAAAITAFLTQ